MTKINFETIHHTAFATADMNKTVRYWKDFLGLPVVLAIDSDEGKQYAFALSRQMLIYFFEWPDVAPIPPKRHGQPVEGPFIFDHFALNLQSMTDLYHLQDMLVEADYPVSDIIDHGYIHSIYTYDPNGIPLEFNVSIQAFDIARHPVIVDPSPVPALNQDAEPIDIDTDPDSDDIPRPVVKGPDSIYFNLPE